MANKDLFLAAFRGEATQRPPAWDQGVAPDVASEVLGRPALAGTIVMHYLEAVAWMKGESAYEEFMAQTEEDRVAFARAMNWSAINYPWLRGRPSRQIDEYTFQYGNDDDWVVYRYDPQVGTYGPVSYSRPRQWQDEEAIRAQVDRAWESVKRWPETGPQVLAERTRRWMALAGDEFEYVSGGAGMAVPLNEEWMIACALVPDLVAQYLDAQVEMGLMSLEVLAAEGVKVINGGGDLASKNGPLYGLRFFRDIVCPRYKRIVDRCRELGLYYIFRSDGDLWSITDLLFTEEGAAAPGFGEIDHDSGMKIPALQARYPHLTCVGNVPCGLLRNGTEGEVRAFVRDLREQVLPHGRWIVAAANAVLPGTPARNYIAMQEEAGVL